jgi:16S rRNA (cytidine1402-2'-O)-methyltransferase
MSGTLFVVATPIGNLEDITLRALRVLKEADLIAAEDTRRTAKLLGHYSISTPTISFHEHNTRTRIPQLLARLEAGAGVALVTDAGTPGISDPGGGLIEACWEKGVTIDPVPGASAPVTAAVASGFPLDPLTIFGFVPSRAKDRKAWMLGAQIVHGTFTFFETPHRILHTLSELPTYCGDRPIFVAREMTKRHQQFIRGAASDVIGQMPVSKGEFTLVVGPAKMPRAETVTGSDRQIFDAFGHMADAGGAGRRAAISTVAKKFGRSAKEVYAIIERLKKSGA